MDFDKGTWNAIQANLPLVVLHGCSFHWKQAVWRHAKDALGLQKAYINDDATKSLLRLVLALPFLPAEHIIPMFRRLQRKVGTPAAGGLCRAPVDCQPPAATV
uniref:MULE transposase domain-containing protein n=1 Tax=Branchiostoma floridae TaxID=7739 RepID=C3YB60_BRAFL|eukprot:XP_002606512.1 hypothetical protein BRAFLDRAFT_91904 [Branchiostoma floridae]